MTFSTNVIVVIAVLALAGCGGGPQADFDKTLAQAEVSALEVRIANDVAGSSYDVFGTTHKGTRRDLPTATRLYITATRKLGSKEAKRHLADTASQVQGSCASCAAALDRERETR